MHRLLDKEKLLALIETEKAFLDRTIALVDPEQMLETVVGKHRRSVKDILAHLAAWQNRLLGWIEASESGGAPLIPEGRHTWDELDELNDERFDHDANLPLDEVTADFAESYDKLLELVRATSEEDLLRPDLYKWTSELAVLADFVSHNTYLHYAGHVAPLREWLAGHQANHEEEGAAEEG